jgi:hypothetical protein
MLEEEGFDEIDRIRWNCCKRGERLYIVTKQQAYCPYKQGRHNNHAIYMYLYPNGRLTFHCWDEACIAKTSKFTRKVHKEEFGDDVDILFAREKKGQKRVRDEKDEDQ